MKLGFEHHILTSLPADELWGLMKKALEDSSKVDAWPGELSRLQRQGDQLEATYEILGTESTYRYDLEVDDAAKSFRYDAVPGQHPFAGGATVEVEGRGRGSDLLWTGVYEAGLCRLPQAAAFKLYFEPKFFSALRSGLRSALPARAQALPGK